ncbi:MAG: NAD-dependent epimerase/dehydratase family protein, partial [Terriglobales bacterium]
MSVIVVTGSAGLIGSEACTYFADLGYDIVGIDNDMRSRFFGPDASTVWNRQRIERQLGKQYSHCEHDIRDGDAIRKTFEKYGKNIAAVIHTAAQPSHDWAATSPLDDFGVNANGTMNLLEATRLVVPDASFVFISTNKVYGDTPNRLPLVELEKRWEIQPGHEYEGGISETMSVDHCLHSLFGVSKLAADAAVQEYGRYFGMKTVCFRGGCLTGPKHSGCESHGFLAYLIKCIATGMPYKVYGYKAKQVRDNIHSSDLVRAFHEFIKAPRSGEAYNMGGGRTSNCSMMEAMELAQSIADRKLNWTYVDQARIGDHIWWISSNAKFM